MDPLSAALKIAGSGAGGSIDPPACCFRKYCQCPFDGRHPGSDPYRRKTVTFGAEVDRANNVTTVGVKKMGEDTSKFIEEYDPDNPAADPKGYVKMPNVNILVEMADMREANRSYEANLQTIKQSRDLISSTIDLLKNAQ